ncbi:MAG: DUF3299 domain-containing protein [Planctomycetes bacterium]|nr:DUF3299 domain-containing protein [Planctomycetota bacterium]MCB9868943.1 DUF3299 domain-containing protein [Planctomycetota bacterium]
MKLATWTLLALTAAIAPVEDPVDTDFATLSGFDFKEGMTLPKDVSKLNGKKVKTSGFMTTEDGKDGEVEYFVLVNDACGCEGTPKINEMIFCAMPEGKKVKIKPGTVWITGTLSVGEEKEEGVVVSLYTMSIESVN